jgi:hypothetical protein
MSRRTRVAFMMQPLSERETLLAREVWALAAAWGRGWCPSNWTDELVAEERFPLPARPAPAPPIPHAYGGPL